jgi:polysaccharide export outer membrane protein
MRQAIYPFLTALSGLFFVAFSLLPVAAHAEEYTLGPGDMVKINVFQEPDLSIESRISNNGIIDYPLIGEIKLSGLNLSEAEDLLDKKLRGDYLINPQITISIARHRPFFITGEVRAPGSYEYQPGMTVRRAIAIAGDFTDRASRSKIFLIRERQGNANSTKVTLDERIGPGDTIHIKESLF